MAEPSGHQVQIGRIVSLILSKNLNYFSRRVYLVTDVVADAEGAPPPQGLHHGREHVGRVRLWTGLRQIRQIQV